MDMIVRDTLQLQQHPPKDFTLYLALFFNSLTLPQ